MRDAKFTPERWELVGREYVRTNPGDKDFRGHNGAIIAKMDMRNFSDDEILANGRLIEDAPEMFSILKWLANNSMMGYSRLPRDVSFPIMRIMNRQLPDEHKWRFNGDVNSIYVEPRPIDIDAQEYRVGDEKREYLKSQLYIIQNLFHIRMKFDEILGGELFSNQTALSLDEAKEAAEYLFGEWIFAKVVFCCVPGSAANPSAYLGNKYQEYLLGMLLDPAGVDVRQVYLQNKNQ